MHEELKYKSRSIDLSLVVEMSLRAKKNSITLQRQTTSSYSNFNKIDIVNN